MSRREKDMLDEEEEEEEEETRHLVAFGGGGGGDSDDEDNEANEDLSLKILEKALARRAADQSGENDAVFNDPNETTVADLCESSSVLINGEADDDDDNEKEEEKVKKNKRKKKKIELENLEKIEIVMKEEPEVEVVASDEKVEMANAKEIVEPMNHSPIQMSDNMVLRKLLRGPRYFDPPDGGWETCYNCGEEGHRTVNCPSATKRKKPCFVCGSLEHGAKQCSKALDCFICKKAGHRARDCPDKYKRGSKMGSICLRCGDSGHDMFSCKNDYSDDDLKDIQCYVCRRFGHLCCVDSSNLSPRKVSCYKCGQLGHTGLSCGRLQGEGTGKESPSSCFRCAEEGHFARECPNSSISFLQAGDSPSSCYKCGEEGHFARECTSSSRFRKRNRGLSTPTAKPRQRRKDQLGHKSTPLEPGKSKRKKIRNEERGLSTPQKSKRRGSWITEDPEDFSPRKIKNKRSKSPSTPTSKSHKISSLTSGGRFSGSQSSKKASYKNYSASRFYNHRNDEFRPNYDQW